MKAGDVMTRRVLTVTPEATVPDAARTMLEHAISGLPVVDRAGHLVGIVTEGDLLRRAETGTTRRRMRWLEFLLGPGRLAEEYVHTHGRKVDEVMTREVVGVQEATPLEEVVALMQQHHVKRLPVVKRGRLVGIVSRADLLHALARLAVEEHAPEASDAKIRERIMAELQSQAWAPRMSIEPVVRHGTVDLWGVITDERERRALCVLCENVPAVKAVRDHLAWIEPVSGMVIEAPADPGRPRGAGQPRGDR